jgi:hypothetical protein
VRWVVLAVAVDHLCDGACYKLLERLVLGGRYDASPAGFQVGRRTLVCRVGSPCHRDQLAVAQLSFCDRLDDVAR